MPTFLYKENPTAPTQRISLETLLQKLGPDKKWADHAFPAGSAKSGKYPGKYQKKYEDFVIVNNPETGLGHTVIANKLIKKGAVLFEYAGEIHPIIKGKPHSTHCQPLGGIKDKQGEAPYEIDGGEWMGFGSLLPAAPSKETLKALHVTFPDKKLSPEQDIAIANVVFEGDNPVRPQRATARALRDIFPGETIAHDYFATHYFSYAHFQGTGDIPCFLNRSGGGKLDKTYTVGSPLVIVPQQENTIMAVEWHLPRSAVSHLEAKGAIRSIPTICHVSKKMLRAEFPSKSYAGKIDPTEVFVYMNPVARADFKMVEHGLYLERIKKALAELTPEKGWKYQPKTDLFVLEITGEKEEEITSLQQMFSALGLSPSIMETKDKRQCFVALPAVVCSTQVLQADAKAEEKSDMAPEKEDEETVVTQFVDSVIHAAALSVSAPAPAIPEKEQNSVPPSAPTLSKESSQAALLADSLKREVFASGNSAQADVSLLSQQLKN